ncbi:MAG TPA: carbamoyl-phosphate synthase large subunit, partial [Peptostreptococcaceae bacterium]|nr:carbamoyl-phosphate synthase large subunit [Peptostreptococcaceae bacterium]
INDYDKDEFIDIAKEIDDLGFKFIATKGTADILLSYGIKSSIINKVNEEKPNILDVIRNDEVDIVINTPTKGNDSTRDGFKIRRTAIEFGSEVITSLDTLKAMIGIMKKDMQNENLKVYNIAE